MEDLEKGIAVPQRGFIFEGGNNSLTSSVAEFESISPGPAGRTPSFPKDSDTGAGAPGKIAAAQGTSNSFAQI
jgi:hypothetical protein